MVVGGWGAGSFTLTSILQYKVTQTHSPGCITGSLVPSLPQTIWVLAEKAFPNHFEVYLAPSLSANNLGVRGKAGYEGTAQAHEHQLQRTTSGLENTCRPPYTEPVIHTRNIPKNEYHITSALVCESQVSLTTYMYMYM